MAKPFKALVKKMSPAAQKRIWREKRLRAIQALKQDAKNRCFKVGEVVMLKSGGPWMVIHDEKDAASLGLQCVWFDGARPVYQRFKAACLERALLKSRIPYA